MKNKTGFSTVVLHESCGSNFAFFVVLQLSEFILIFMPENALKTCFVYVNCNANMGKNTPGNYVCNFDEYRSQRRGNKENTLLILCHQKFVLILRGRKMLVCMWISFITLETHSLLLSPLGKQRSTGCTCWSFPSPPQFLQQ